MSEPQEPEAQETPADPIPNTDDEDTAGELEPVSADDEPEPAAAEKAAAAPSPQKPFSRFLIEKAVVPIILALISAASTAYVVKDQADTEHRKEDAVRKLLEDYVRREASAAYVDSSVALSEKMLADLEATLASDEPVVSVEGDEKPEFELKELVDLVKDRPEWMQQQMNAQLATWDAGRIKMAIAPDQSREN
jgi:hypothetical protein